eukprot:Pgem_evm1s18095
MAFFVLVLVCTVLLRVTNAQYYNISVEKGCVCPDFFTVTLKPSSKDNSKEPTLKSTLTRKPENNRNNDAADKCTTLYCGIKNNPLLFSEIEDYAFSGFNNLKTLSFAAGVIENLNWKIFDGLRFLSVLDLADNRLKYLYSMSNAYSVYNVEERGGVDQLFRKHLLPNLKTLILKGNPLYLNSVIQNPFSALVKLENLDLSNINNNLDFNNIASAFAGLSNLKNLNVSSNGLMHFPDFKKVPLPSLQSLDVRENYIEIFTITCFDGLSNLTSIELAHNAIRFIDENTFQNKSILKHIGLIHNRLNQIPIALNSLFEKNITFNVELLSNPMINSTVPKPMLQYMNYMQHNFNQSVNISIDFPSCCSEGSRTFHNALYQNENVTNISGCFMNLEGHNSSSTTNNLTHFVFGEFNLSSLCLNTTRACNLKPFHYFNESDGQCMDKIADCEALYGPDAYFNKTKASEDRNADGNGACQDVAAMRANCESKPHYTFENVTFVCVYNATAAAVSCAEIGETLHQNNCVETRNMSSNLAIIFSCIGVLLVIATIVSIFYYRYNEKRKNRLESDTDVDDMADSDEELTSEHCNIDFDGLDLGIMRQDHLFNSASTRSSDYELTTNYKQRMLHRLSISDDDDDDEMMNIDNSYVLTPPEPENAGLFRYHFSSESETEVLIHSIPDN